MKISILQNCFSCDEAVRRFDGLICKAMTNIYSTEKDPAGAWLIKHLDYCGGCRADADDCPCWINRSLGMHGDWYQKESARKMMELKQAKKEPTVKE
jgi:hypothetical protein